MVNIIIGSGVKSTYFFFRVSGVDRRYVCLLYPMSIRFKLAFVFALSAVVALAVFVPLNRAEAQVPLSFSIVPPSAGQDVRLEGEAIPVTFRSSPAVPMGQLVYVQFGVEILNTALVPVLPEFFYTSDIDDHADNTSNLLYSRSVTHPVSLTVDIYYAVPITGDGSQTDFTINVPTFVDEINADATVRIELVEMPAYTLASPPTALYSILDRTHLPLATISGPEEVDEYSDLNIIFIINEISAEALPIAYTEPTSATPTALLQETIGDHTLQKTLVLMRASPDSLEDDTVTFRLQEHMDNLYDLGDDTQVTVRIRNQDSQLGLYLQENRQRVAVEGETVALELRREGDIREQVTVAIRVDRNGFQETRTVTVPSDTATHRFDVAVVDRELASDNYVTFTLLSADGVPADLRPSFTDTNRQAYLVDAAADDIQMAVMDALPIVSITADSAEQDEGGVVDLTFMRTGATTVEQFISYVVSYVDSGGNLQTVSRSVTVPVSETSVTVRDTVTIGTDDDILTVNPVSVTFMLMAEPVLYQLGSPAEAVVTRRDNDAVIVASITAGVASVVLGAEVSFTVAVDRAIPLGQTALFTISATNQAGDILTVSPSSSVELTVGRYGTDGNGVGIFGRFGRGNAAD